MGVPSEERTNFMIEGGAMLYVGRRGLRRGIPDAGSLDDDIYVAGS